MDTQIKPGTTVKVTINKHIRRAAAIKTLERLFLQDKAVSGPIAAREKNFIPLPKRRGGRIWTKRPNKTHPQLVQGATATFKLTTQTAKDLASVSDLVDVAAA